jgi:hypothetical protein
MPTHLCWKSRFIERISKRLSLEFSLIREPETQGNDAENIHSKRLGKKRVLRAPRAGNYLIKQRDFHSHPVFSGCLEPRVASVIKSRVKSVGSVTNTPQF